MRNTSVIPDGLDHTMRAVQEILCPQCHTPNRPDARFCGVCGHNTVLNDDQPSDDRRYFITRIIKQGGQGSVYAGVDETGKVYAIKEMLDHFTDPAERQEAMRRFNLEADILQRLSDPRIPRVYSHFTDEGRHYLTMDFVQGKDLETIIDEAGTLPEAQVLEWGVQIAEVLGYLHEQGLIYRDVKPSNIMITDEDGSIKLVDFGIAKNFNPAARGGTQIGTPGYAPPEQYQGLATPQSDIYALGATLHHLLTGRDPTEHTPFSFPPARDLNIKVSRTVSDALQQALEYDVNKRIQSMVEFRALLRQPGLSTSRTGQVRVAPPTGTTAASQANTPGSIQQQSAPAPAPRAPTSQPRQPQPQPARPAPQPQTSGSRGMPRGLVSLAIVLALLTVLTFSGLAYLQGYGERFAPGVLPAPPDISMPGFVESWLPAYEPPDAAPDLQPPQFFTLDVQATLPASADDAAIRAALIDSYLAELERQYPGAQTRRESINPVGGYQQVGSSGGETTYRATMQGFVALPEE